MDDIVGRDAKALKPDDLLVVLSDHGFATWRRSVNYNSWLVQNGYLVLKGNAKRQNLEALFSRGEFWEAVDWSKSRAYAMGLGDVYVNLAGREAGGIVSPGAEYEALRTELVQRLIGPRRSQERREGGLARLQAGGTSTSASIRSDPRPERDQPAGVSRVLASSLGVPTDNVFEDNRDVWSGDHCSLDPELVKGILFASRAFRADPPPGIADVTASVRRVVGGPDVPDAAGKSFW